MDLAFIEGIGWRDGVLLLAGLIGVYLVLSVMRLLQMGTRRRASGEDEAVATPEAWEPRILDPVAGAPGPVFAQELARSNVEVELQTLRREAASVREELLRLTEEVSRLKATRNVSPLYNEAMTLAQQGMPAAGIAGRCGISIGEAELVAALSRSDAEFELHQENEENEDDHERHATPGIRARG